MNSESLQTSTDRLRLAYSPESTRQLGHALIDTLAKQLENAHERTIPVLNWNSPENNLLKAQASLDSQCSTVPHELIPQFRELIDTALDRGHNLHHPRYIGHQVPASVPIAGLFDALGSMTNQVMAVYEMGPWITSIERALIEK